MPHFLVNPRSRQGERGTRCSASKIHVRKATRGRRVRPRFQGRPLFKPNGGHGSRGRPDACADQLAQTAHRALALQRIQIDPRPCTACHIQWEPAAGAVLCQFERATALPRTRARYPSASFIWSTDSPAPFPAGLSVNEKSRGARQERKSHAPRFVRRLIFTITGEPRKNEAVCSRAWAGPPF
jgi:hypothetical protein